jgi:hypothetical protein
VRRMSGVFFNSGISRHQFDSWEGWTTRVQELEDFEWEYDEEGWDVPRVLVLE